MSRIEPPCNHWDAQIGTVCAGDPTPGAPGAFCGVATCEACVVKSQGYVTWLTGLPAEPLLTYEESRARTDSQ